MNLKYGVNTIKKLSTLSKFLLIALSVLGIGTLAVASGQIPAISGAKTSDAVAIAQSKISLEQAVAIAQKNMTAMLVSTDLDQNRYTSDSKDDIKFDPNDLEDRINIDVEDSKVLKTRLDTVDTENMSEQESFRLANNNLFQAMQKATQTVSGKAIESGLDLKNTKPIHEIDIAEAAQIYNLILSGMTDHTANTQSYNNG